MRRWLVKSEPDVYSIEDLRRDGTTNWGGVRNYQARNFLKEMKAGDRALYYHSSTARGAIVGEAEVAREAYPDPTQFDSKSEYHDPKATKESPRWFQVDLKFVRVFKTPLPIQDVRGMPALKDMVLVKHGRLSVQPVRPEEWAAVLKACS